MTQPPLKINSTTDNKTLVKGVTYSTIFSSCNYQIELSTEGTYLKKKIYNDGIMTAESLYEKINNPDEIRRVEESGNDWITFDGDKQYGYIVRGQINKTGKYNGYYKVVESDKVKITRNKVKRSPIIDSKIEDWIYYKRRTAHE